MIKPFQFALGATISHTPDTTKAIHMNHLRLSPNESLSDSLRLCANHLNIVFGRETKAPALFPESSGPRSTTGGISLPCALSAELRTTLRIMKKLPASGTSQTGLRHNAVLCERPAVDGSDRLMGNCAGEILFRLCERIVFQTDRGTRLALPLLLAGTSCSV